MQISDIIDTSFKPHISGQSTTDGKKLYLHKFDMVDTVFSYGKTLIVCLFLQESSKVKESSLQVI